jgi:PGF-pre-PGF domain-containing protein
MVDNMSFRTISPTLIVLSGTLIFMLMQISLASAQYFPLTPPEPIVVRETNIVVSYTEPQRTVVINVTQFDPLQPTKKLTLTFKQAVLSVSLTIYQLKEKPPEAPEPPNVPLLYFTIRVHEDLLKNVEKAAVFFSLEKETIKAKGVDEKTITLNRLLEGKWEKLPTTKVTEDEKYSYFEAESLGLSHFVVTGVALPPPFPWWIVLVVVVVIVVIGIIMWTYVERKRSAKKGKEVHS